MSLFDRAGAAYRAFTAPASAAPAAGAVKLREVPRTAPGPLAAVGDRGRPNRKRRVERLAFDYRRWMPSDVESALRTADGSGYLYNVAAIAAWVKSNPIVYGVIEGRISTPWLPYGVNFSEEADVWLRGRTQSKDPGAAPSTPGWRDRICDPSELEAIAIDDYNAGYGGGIFVWNERKGHPELMALDNAGFRYLPGEDRYQYHGWSHVYDVEPGNGIWVMKTRVKSDPWREGVWHKIAYAIMDSLQASMQRSAWMHVFSMPTVLAKYPLGSSESQKAKFTNAILGSALRVIGVTPGFDLDYKQASAEGTQTFKDVEEQLERTISILAYGTMGLINGGSGFSNSELFEQQKASVISKEARKQARFENDQIWPQVFDWAIKAGYLSPAAAHAQVEYISKGPVVIKAEAEAITAAAGAYKALVDAGITPDEARMIVQLQIPAKSTQEPILSAQPALPELEDPTAREDVGATEELPEASYSEQLAARLTERGDSTCPHGRKPYCRSCGVRIRHEEIDGAWREVWHPITRTA